MVEVASAYEKLLSRLSAPGLIFTDVSKQVVTYASSKGSFVPSRVLTVVKDSSDNICYIKFPKYKSFNSQAKLTINEELAYVTNCMLGFNTVPVTLALEHHRKLADRYIAEVYRPRFGIFYVLINPTSDNNGYAGTTVQQYVKQHSRYTVDDIILGAAPDAAVKSSISTDNGPDSTHASSADASSSTFGDSSTSDNTAALADKLPWLNMDSVYQAILFNMIVGRHDAGLQNSVIVDGCDEVQAWLMDIDNEYIGYDRTDYWLIPLFMNCIIPRTVIDKLLKCNLQPLVDTIGTDRCTVIVNNFNRLAAMLSQLTVTRQSTTITVAELADIFYAESKVGCAMQ